MPLTGPYFTDDTLITVPEGGPRQVSSVELDKERSSSTKDRDTNKSIDFFIGSPFRIRFALFAGSPTTLDGVANYTSFKIEIAPDKDSLRVLVPTYSPVNQLLALEDWQAGTDQHGVFDFTEADAAAFSERDYYWVISAQRTVDNKSVVLGHGTLTARNAGLDGDVVATPSPVGSYYTIAEIDAIEATKQPLNATLTKLAANTTIQSATLYVDAASAVTGVRGDPFSPFATLAAAVAAASAGDTIVMRPGTHLVPTFAALTQGSGVTISVADVTIEGHGKAILRYSSDDQKNRMLKFTAAGGKVRGVTFDGRCTGPTNAYRSYSIEVLGFYGATDGVVENCRFINNGIFSIGAYGSPNLRVQSNTFDGCLLGLFAETLSGVAPNNTRFLNNIFTSPQSTGSPSNFSLARMCAIHTKDDVPLYGAQVIGNQAIGGSNSPLEMGVEIWGPAGTCFGSIVANNRIERAVYGVSMDHCDGWTFTGNHLKCSYFYSLEIATNTRKGTVTGNIFDCTDPDTGALSTSNDNVRFQSTTDPTIPNFTSISGNLFIGGRLESTNARKVSVGGNTFVAVGSSYAGDLLQVGEPFDWDIHDNQFFSLSGATGNACVRLYADGTVTGARLRNNSFSATLPRAIHLQGSGSLPGLEITGNRTGGGVFSVGALDDSITGGHAGSTIKGNLAPDMTAGATYRIIDDYGNNHGTTADTATTLFEAVKGGVSGQSYPTGYRVQLIRRASGAGTNSFSRVIIQTLQGSGAWADVAWFDDYGLNLKNVPTASTGLESGRIWSNSGVLTIVP